MAAPLLAFQATLEQRIGAVDLGLPKVLLGLFKNTCNGATKLWPCNGLVGNILSCHWFKYMMVMTRVKLVLTR